MKNTKQPMPLILGDIVRILPHKNNDDSGFEGHIAVVTEVDRSTDNGGYPYRMHVVSGHPYTSEIWFSSYVLIGNVSECVALLSMERIRHQLTRELVPVLMKELKNSLKK